MGGRGSRASETREEATVRAMAAHTRGPSKATALSPPSPGHLPERAPSQLPAAAPQPVASAWALGMQMAVHPLPGVSSLEARGKCVSTRPVLVTALERGQGQKAGLPWTRASWVRGGSRVAQQGGAVGGGERNGMFWG